MNLFDVYPLFDINIVKGKGCHVWDENGTEYLDLYGDMLLSPSVMHIRITWR